jgi:hypothetical protein
MRIRKLRPVEPCRSCPRSPGVICDWHQGLIAAREEMEAAEKRMAERKAAGQVP